MHLEFFIDFWKKKLLHISTKKSLMCNTFGPLFWATYGH
jgi:hypothetical protein